MKKNKNYSLPPPKHLTFKKILKFNSIFNNDKFKEIKLFEKKSHILKANDPCEIEEWSTGIAENKERIKILKELSPYRGIIFSELVDFTRYRDEFTIERIKLVMSKQKFVNFSIQEHQFNLLLTIQGFTINNFTNFFFLRDMRFRDKVCSKNIEFNNPYGRQKIRESNREGIYGQWYENEVELSQLL